MQRPDGHLSLFPRSERHFNRRHAPPQQGRKLRISVLERLGCKNIALEIQEKTLTLEKGTDNPYV